MGELAAEMAIALNEPAGREDKPDPTPRDEHKNTPAYLINNKTINTTNAESQAGRVIGDIQLNPPHGEKDGFERMSITLPPEIRQRLLDESNRRKKEHSPDWSISVIVREALAGYLK
jgi:hypothetical protein